MAGIRGKDTSPERIVRSFLHRAGLRFRTHGPDLPGRPDVVLPRWNTVIFVHGCFWHRHPECRFAATPRSNRRFWLAKFRANIARDERNLKELKADGWRVFTVWECKLTSQSLDKLLGQIIRD